MATKSKKPLPKSESNSMTTSDGSMEAMRDEIDSIDDNILTLINQRLSTVQRYGALRKEEDRRKDRFDAEEKRSLERLCKSNGGPLNDGSLMHIFRGILSASREIQAPQRISYLGPEATFTHIAALNHFGEFATFIPQPSIRDVFSEVEKGICPYGVVPVENSIEGSVNYTLDLFFESDLKICAEEHLIISHDLLSQSGKLEDIEVIYSHPQPFAQCRDWLRRHLPDVPLRECSSTSEAARRAASQIEAAAIASNEAARIYNLKTAASKIEDQLNNTTRFLVIGHQAALHTGRDKTSIMFSAPHIPGALYKVLEPIAKTGINMLKLESRPSKNINWNYFFFVDLEGHLQDSAVHETIGRMEKICLFLKVLGSYPRAGE